MNTRAKFFTAKIFAGETPTEPKRLFEILPEISGGGVRIPK